MTTPKAWINGEDSRTVSMFDRGLLYGHTAFETIKVVSNKPCLKELHIARLQRSCAQLSIPFERSVVVDELERFCSDVHLGVVRLSISIGEGGRGYASPSMSEAEPVRLLSLHELPEAVVNAKSASEGVNIGVSEVRLSHQPHLAGIKHGNRLEQILIRKSWQEGWQEALVLDQNQYLIEATQSNVFLRTGDVISTPPLDQAGVAGVMRECILDVLKQTNFRVSVEPVHKEQINEADEIVLSNSLIGVWPTAKILANTQTESKTFKPNEFKLSTTLTQLLKQYGAL